jgi:hypothetical protein
MKKALGILAVTLLFAIWGSTPVMAGGPVPVPIPTGPNNTCPNN